MTLLLYSNNTRTAGDSVDWTRHIYKEKTLPLNNAHLKDGHITTMHCWVRYWYSLITPEPPLILIFIFFLNSPAEQLSLIFPFIARVKPPVAAPLWLPTTRYFILMAHVLWTIHYTVRWWNGIFIGHFTNLTQYETILSVELFTGHSTHHRESFIYLQSIACNNIFELHMKRRRSHPWRVILNATLEDVKDLEVLNKIPLKVFLSD